MSDTFAGFLLGVMFGVVGMAWYYEGWRAVFFGRKSMSVHTALILALFWTLWVILTWRFIMDQLPEQWHRITLGTMMTLAVLQSWLVAFVTLRASGRRPREPHRS